MGCRSSRRVQPPEPTTSTWLGRSRLSGAVSTPTSQSVESGARIVHSCGFDSIPSDFTVYALRRRPVTDGAGEFADTAFVLRALLEGLRRGFGDTMFDLMRPSSSIPKRARCSTTPTASALTALPSPIWALSRTSVAAWRGHRPRAGGVVDQRVRHGAVQHPLCAAVQRPDEWAYGRSFRYTETRIMGSSPGRPRGGAMFNAASPPLPLRRPLLADVPNRLLDEPDDARGGTGNDMGRAGITGSRRTRPRLRARYGRRSRTPPTPATPPPQCWPAKARSLWHSTETSLPDRHGVLTPASAMGDVLLDRLPPPASP